MTTAELKQKPIVDGCIFVSEREFKDYVKFLIEKRKAIYPEEELARQEKDMLSGRQPVTFFEYRVRVQG